MIEILLLNDMHIAEPGLHYQKRDSGMVFRETLQVLIDERRPDLLLINGDVCAADPFLGAYHQVRHLSDRLEVPTVTLPGNHDDPEMMKQLLPFPRSTLSSIGADRFHIHPDDPYCGWCSLQGWGVLWLNTFDHTLDASQLAWLDASMESFRADHGTIVFMHHPPVPIPNRFMEARFPLKNRDQAWRTLQRIPDLRRVFCGHYHRSWEDPRLPVTMVSSSLYTMDPEADDHRVLHRNPSYARLMLGTNLQYAVEELPENMLQP